MSTSMFSKLITHLQFILLCVQSCTGSLKRHSRATKVSALLLIQNFDPLTIQLSQLAIFTLGLVDLATLQMTQP